MSDKQSQYVKNKMKNMSDRQTDHMSDCIYYMNIKYKFQIECQNMWDMWNRMSDKLSNDLPFGGFA